MTFKDDNLRFTLLKAIIDSASAELDQMRAGHLAPLLERYDEDGTKSFSVRLPGGALIGSITLPEPKDKYEVTDDAAFTAWFAENHPDAVTVEVIPGEPERTVVVPATPDETITTINPRHRNAIIKNLDQTENGEIVDTITGSFVQGVTFTPGKRPDKFSVNYEPKGRDLLAAAYRAGELDSLVSGTSLPPVNGRVIIERHLEPVPVAPPADDVDPVQGALEDHFGEYFGVNLAAGSEDYPDETTIDDPTWRGADPWAVTPPVGGAGEFDPGDWGAASGQTGTGW